MLQFFAPGLQVLTLPAWDCLPYDRSSPNRQVVAARMRTLGLLAEDGLAGRVLLTTVNAITQRVPARATVTDGRFVAGIGDRIDEAALTTFLVGQGYSRTGTVMEPGEYAIRGGLIDIFPPNDSYPVRLDLFGQELESIRLFDSMTQRTLEKIDRFELTPVGELVLEPPTVNLFRARYRELFGDRLRVLIYERFVEEPAAAAELCRFLGVDPGAVRPVAARDEESTGVDYEPSPELLERLREHYAGPNRELADLIGEDLSLWSAGVRSRR